MSTSCEMFGLTYVNNYSNDPLLVDFNHLSEYVRGRLADHVKAKVGYYLVPRLVIGEDFFKLSDYVGVLSNYVDVHGDYYDGMEDFPTYLEFYPPKHLGVRPPLVIHIDKNKFFCDPACLGNNLDVNYIPKLKKYRYVYDGEIRKLIRAIDKSIYLQLRSYVINVERNGLGLQNLCGCLRCERIRDDDLIERGELDRVIESMEFDWDALVMNYSYYDINNRYEFLMEWYKAINN